MSHHVKWSADAEVMALEGPDHAIGRRVRSATASGPGSPSASSPSPRPFSSTHGLSDHHQEQQLHQQQNQHPQQQQDQLRQLQQQPKRTVCDNCRKRRVRCDGEFPCNRCLKASLTCRRDHVPRKRGPKPGHGKVIDGIRASDDYTQEQLPASGDSGVTNAPHSFGPRNGSPPLLWTNSASPHDSNSASEPQSPFSTDQLRPNARSYLGMIPQLVSLYYEHIYPIMPLVYMPEVRQLIERPTSPPEKRHIYALCALTAFHMSGKSVDPATPPSPAESAKHPAWETVGRFFLDEGISARQSYDFEDDVSLPAIIASFWTSTSFFEIDQTRKSWYYLKEALTLALDLGLDNEAKYVGLSPQETICRRRVFWILFVTERSFAILRRKPLTLSRTPLLPSGTHPYEKPDIQAGFLKLIFQYYPLNSAFVNAWNEDETDPSINKDTFLALHSILNESPTSPLSSPSSSPRTASKKEDPSELEPTVIQKADLLMTQQWLRLIVWQSSLRQGLLSNHARDPCMTFSFPLSVAQDTVSVLRALPEKAVEVHGMGIFEKIFEIASTCVNVMETCEQTWGRMEMLDLSRKQYLHNPIEFFVSRLSASENSKRLFADKLVMLANQQPAAMKISMSPPLQPGAWHKTGSKQKRLPAPTPSSPTKHVNIKMEPGTEISTALSASPFSQSTSPKREPLSTPYRPASNSSQNLPCRKRGAQDEDDVEEIERASSVCYAGRFGYYF